MPHREPRMDELCEQSKLLGVHTWQWVTEKQKEGRRMVRFERVRCLHCGREPRPQLRARLEHERELGKRRERIARELHQAQKEATGVQLSGRKKTA